METDLSPSRFIDVHMHFLPACYREALDRAGMSTLDGGVPVPDWSEELALRTMDDLNIETAILSVSSPSVRFVRGKAERQLCRAINIAGADLVRRRPDRFGLFVTLPLPDLDGALAELEFCQDELGMDGVVLDTNIRGIYLGDERLAPLFDELDRRAATVFLHPTSPACFAEIGLGRPAPMIEFPMDTARSVVDLLYSGTLRRCQNMNMIIPHGGGVLPVLAQRIAAFASRPFMSQILDGEDEVFDTLARLHYDIVQSGHSAAIGALKQIAPTTQMLFGSDWPFSPPGRVTRNVEHLSANMSEGELENIARENALRLFPRLASTQTGCACGTNHSDTTS